MFDILTSDALVLIATKLHELQMNSIIYRNFPKPWIRNFRCVNKFTYTSLSKLFITSINDTLKDAIVKDLANYLHKNSKIPQHFVYYFSLMNLLVNKHNASIGGYLATIVFHGIDLTSIQLGVLDTYVILDETLISEKRIRNLEALGFIETKTTDPSYVSGCVQYSIGNIHISFFKQITHTPELVFISRFPYFEFERCLIKSVCCVSYSPKCKISRGEEKRVDTKTPYYKQRCIEYKLLGFSIKQDNTIKLTLEEKSVLINKLIKLNDYDPDFIHPYYPDCCLNHPNHIPGIEKCCYHECRTYNENEIFLEQLPRR